MSTRDLLGIFGLFLAIACGGATAKPVSLRAILDKAKDNTYAAAAELKDGPVRLEGVVEKFGIRPLREAKVRGDGSVRPEGQYPFLLIVPGDSKPGRCMCFFPYEELDAVQARPQGSKVAVVAHYDSFMLMDGQDALLADCEFVD